MKYAPLLSALLAIGAADAFAGPAAPPPARLSGAVPPPSVHHRPGVEACRPTLPADFDLRLLRPPVLAPLRASAVAPVPAAGPAVLPATDAFDACAAAVKRDRTRGCLVGDVVIVNAQGLMFPAGRCTRDPTDTKAWYVSVRNNTMYRRVFATPGITDIFETFVYFSDFKMAADPRVPRGSSQSCPLAWHTTDGQVARGISLGYRPPGPGTRRAVTNMWSINDWKESELLDPVAVAPLNVLAHETEHDVCCYVRHVEPGTGACRSSLDCPTGTTCRNGRCLSSRLIGQQGAHWSFYFNTFGQLMYGGNWRDEGNGTFYSITPARGTRALDRYLWGLIPASEVPEMFYLDTRSERCTPRQATLDSIKVSCATMRLPGTTATCKDDFERCKRAFDLCLDPPFFRSTDTGQCVPYSDVTTHSPTRIRAQAKKRTVKIGDITAALGPRVPDYRASPKVVKQLFVLLTGDPETPLTRASLARVERVRRVFSRHLYRVTGHMLRTVSTVSLRDDGLLWEWGGRADWQGDQEFEGWKGVKLKRPLAFKPGRLEVHLTDGSSGIIHNGVEIRGPLYNAYQVVLTVPPPSGKPALVHGKIVLIGKKGSATLRFPVMADGKRHAVTVRPPHRLLSKGRCGGCVAVCRRDGKKLPVIGPDGKQEKDRKGKPRFKDSFTWFDSCTGKPFDAWRKGQPLASRQCKDALGVRTCGPYCAGQGTSAEGWVDSCQSQLTDTYERLLIQPVAEAAAARLGGPVLVDRVDIFNTFEVLEKERDKNDGEKDFDGDGIINAFDVCPRVADPGQADANGDGHGDACDDFDADGTPDALDNCPLVVNASQADADGDGKGDACDADASEGCALGGAGRPGAPPAALLFVALLLAAGRSRARE